ncbi:hypothetical protein PC113_g4545 [Phytophthora cactorum]|uniref:Uncharacterized protein n=1 Tax=Phytophthora cactorum TaxID=29920 RepID=A0A8T0ZMV6_9STRA|nr:hypothetical protein PC113_g4545 [Phytophthora cactorum]KAG3032068.1 hypothetical protein PC120_g2728 [Phytophthora cactorum]KAG3085455.1 hypothetical protein PC121_g5176 [Phytophthora cactorum]
MASDSVGSAAAGQAGVSAGVDAGSDVLAMVAKMLLSVDADADEYLDHYDELVCANTDSLAGSIWTTNHLVLTSDNSSLATTANLSPPAAITPRLAAV